MHLSRDGVVVVHHDATLERTTNGTRAAGARARPPSSPRLDAGWHFGAPRIRFAARPAAFRRWRRCSAAIAASPIIVELKVNDPGWPRATIDDIRAAGALDRVAVGSFGTRVLRAARAYEPRLLTGSSREETTARAVSIVGPLAGAAVRPTTRSRCRRRPAGRASSRRASSATRTRADWRCRSGRSIAPTTCSGCSTGASTASSPIGPTSPSTWSGSFVEAETRRYLLLRQLRGRRELRLDVHRHAVSRSSSLLHLRPHHAEPVDQLLGLRVVAFRLQRHDLARQRGHGVRRSSRCRP